MFIHRERTVVRLIIKEVNILFIAVLSRHSHALRTQPIVSVHAVVVAMDLTAHWVERGEHIIGRAAVPHDGQIFLVA